MPPLDPGLRPGAGGSLSEVRTLHANQLRAWRLGYGLTAVGLVVAAAATEIAVERYSVLSLTLPWPPGLATALVFFAGATFCWLWPRALFQRWSYELGESCLDLKRGVVVFRHTSIPYHRVQNINTSRSPIERHLGLTQLVIHTASSGTDAHIPGIGVEDADDVRRLILERAGRGDQV